MRSFPAVPGLFPASASRLRPLGRRWTAPRSRQPDWQWKLDILVSALIAVDKRLQKKGKLRVATLTQFLGNIGRDVARPSLGGVKTDDADRIVVLPSQHVLDHGCEIAGAVGFGSDLAAFTAIVHHR